MPRSEPLARFVGPAIHSHGRGAVEIHEGVFTAGMVVPAHVHAAAVVSLVLGGAARERVAEGPREISAQHLIITPAYEEHSYHFHESGSWLNMQMSEAWVARATDGRPFIYERSTLLRSLSAASWAMRVRSEIRHPDTASSLAIDGAMMLMIADLARTKLDEASVRPRWLRRTEEALESALAKPPSLDVLAGIAGVNPRHLLRTFRRYHGTTIANFVRTRRLERARSEVATSGRPLSVIALESGFADQAHFTRLFKKAFGETPGQFARSVRLR